MIRKIELIRRTLSNP